MRSRYLICALTATLISFSDVYAAENLYRNKCKEYGFLNCDDIAESCSQIIAIKIPDQDKPSENEQKSLEGCSSEELYYGYGKTTEYATARKCAYLQIEQNKADGVFDGRPVLMTMYANGEGVKRNLDIALKFACDDDAFAPAEYLGRIMHINKMRQDNTSRRFDYCDDITSSNMIGYCAARRVKLDKAKRGMAFQKITDKWSKSEKQAFEKMLVLWKMYLKAREDEIDQSGMARAVMVIEDQESLEEKFFSSMSEYESGIFPILSERESVLEDQSLNRVYKQIQDTKDSEWIGTDTKNKIKNAQRAWIKYRDAWLAFARMKYPTVTEAAWKAKLTRERTALLHEFIETN